MAEIVERAVRELIPYARNPRKNDAVMDQMAASIREFGFNVPILALSDGTIVDGHLRLKATQKPIECMSRPISNHTNPGQAVYDPFMGSGTTIIAAEGTGRVCFEWAN